MPTHPSTSRSRSDGCNRSVHLHSLTEVESELASSRPRPQPLLSASNPSVPGRGREGLVSADSVEEVGFEVIAAAWLRGREDVAGGCDGSCGGGWYRRRDQDGELAKVLGGGGKVELVAGAIRAAQSQPIEPQDAFGVGEQHLDFLSLSP